MIIDRDLERAVRTWVAEGPEQLPDPLLDAALQQVARIPQHGAVLPRAAFAMLRTSTAVWAAAAVVIALAALLTMTILPGPNVGPTVPRGSPTATPLPTPIATPGPTPSAARVQVIGSFDAVFGAVVIDAAGRRERITGSMEVTNKPTRAFSVELRCSTAPSDEVLLLGGVVVESTNTEVAVGDRVAIALGSADPQTSIFWFEGRRRTGDCAAFLGRVPDLEPFLQPIEGELEIEPLPGA